MHRMTPTSSYRPGREIARGGMGAVLDARDNKLGRSVAMKVMLRRNASEEEQQRFLQEARVLGQLAHPNIVPVHDVGTDEQGRLFYTMKLVQGVTLHDVIGKLKAEDQETLAKYPLNALLTVFQKVCDAVAFAHSRGIIHRDLKPQNIMVGEFGEVLVMDWGLAKILPGSAAAKEAAKTPMVLGPTMQSGPTGTLLIRPLTHPRSTTSAEQETLLSSDADTGAHLGVPVSQDTPLTWPASTQLTLDGTVMGTPNFMSPEQADGRVAELDARSDVFSLGGVLHTILTLRPPFEGKDVSEVLNKVLYGDIIDPARSTRRARLPHLPDGMVPEALSAVCMKALCVARRDRYQTVAEFASDVAAHQGGFATTAERAGPLMLLWLFLRRHRALSAAGAVMLALTIGFIVSLARERDVARRNATDARNHAATAATNELRAIASEKLAHTSEAKAQHSAEQQRREAARARVLLADAAAGAADLPTLVRALDQCPSDLRDQTWEYLAAKRDASLTTLSIPGFERPSVVAAVPGQPGQFGLANTNGEIAFVNVSNSAVQRVVKTGRNGLALLAFTLDGTGFAVARSGSSEVDWFDTATGQRLMTVALSHSNVHWLAAGPSREDSLVAAYTSAPNQVPRLQLIDMRTGATRWQLDSYFTGAVIHPDGDRVLVGSAYRRLLILNTADGTERARLEVFVNAHSLSADGRLLAIGTASGEVLLVNSATGAVIQRAKTYSGSIKSLAWLGDTHLLTMGSEGKFAELRWVFRLVETKLLTTRATFFGLRQGQVETEWSLHPDNGDLVTLDQPPRLWSFPVDRELARKTHESEQAWGGVFVADNVLIARDGYRLTHYNDRLVKLPGPTWDHTLVANHLASKQLALAKHTRGSQPSLKVLTNAAENPVEKFNLPVKVLVNNMTFDRSGERLAVTTRDGAVELFSLADGRSFLRRDGKFERMVFAETNLFAIAAHANNAERQDYRLERLDMATLQTCSTLGKDFPINALAVSPDERWLAFAGGDRNIYLVQTEPLPDGSFKEGSFFRAHDGEIGVVAFHPTQPILATASADGSVKLWDHRTPKRPLASFLGLEGMPVALSFNPSGTRLLIDGQERTTRVYDVSNVTVK